MRRTATILVLLVTALIAGRASARTDVATPTCKAGFKSGVVAGKAACLKAGQTCLAKRESDYARSGFTCRNGHLRLRAVTTAKRPLIGPGSSRANPVPLGKPGSLRNGWTLTITAVNPDATSAILAAEPANKPPIADFQYVLVSVSATYNGPGSSHLNPGSSFHAIGDSGFAHSTSNSHCGTLPSPNLDLTNPLVYKGGAITGYAACWMVANGDVASLKMYYQPLLVRDQVWFSLH